MKKALYVILLCLCINLFSGCSDSNNSSDIAADQLSSLESSNENNDDEETEEEKPIKARDREIDTNNEFVFDDGKILTEGEYDLLNSYTAWLAKAFKINAAVVLTDDIEGQEPSDYAESYYNDIYKGDGVLFLVNNDTNEDYLYRKGRPAEFITDGKVQMMFSEISPMLALEEYVSAAETALEMVEQYYPEYFTDRSGNIDKKEISEYSDIIEAAAGNNSLNMYYVEGIGDSSIEDFAKKRYEMFYDDGADAAILVIDGNNGDNYLCASGSMDYLNGNKSELQEAVKSLYSKNDGVDLKKAAEQFATFVSET